MVTTFTENNYLSDMLYMDIPMHEEYLRQIFDKIVKNYQQFPLNYFKNIPTDERQNFIQALNWSILQNRNNVFITWVNKLIKEYGIDVVNGMENIHHLYVNSVRYFYKKDDKFEQIDFLVTNFIEKNRQSINFSEILNQKLNELYHYWENEITQIPSNDDWYKMGLKKIFAPVAFE